LVPWAPGFRTRDGSAKRTPATATCSSTLVDDGSSGDSSGSGVSDSDSGCSDSGLVDDGATSEHHHHQYQHEHQHQQPASTAQTFV
jgi:hypothetical protein